MPPAQSKSQRRMMGMIAHASPEQIEAAGPTVQEAASSLSKDQARDFAKTPEKGLPEHAHHKHKKHHKPHEDKGGGGRKANPRGGSY